MEDIITIIEETTTLDYEGSTIATIEVNTKGQQVKPIGCNKTADIDLISDDDEDNNEQKGHSKQKRPSGLSPFELDHSYSLRKKLAKKRSFPFKEQGSDNKPEVITIECDQCEEKDVIVID